MPKVVSYLPPVLFERNKVETPPGWNLIFAQKHGEEEIIEACKDADFLMVTAANPPITAQIIQSIPSVCLLQVFGTGFDKIDIEAAKEGKLPERIPLAKMPPLWLNLQSEQSIALQRKIMIGNRSKGRKTQGNRAGVHQNRPERNQGTNIGLVGLGTIGRQVARLANFMGARVSYYDPYRPDKKIEDELKVRYCSFTELLQNNEVISLHVPLNEDTRWLISRNELALMQPGALLINTARGEILDQAALAEALESGHPAGLPWTTFAGSAAAGSSFVEFIACSNEKFIASPHIAGVTASFSRMLEEALANIQRVAAGENPKYVVNGITSPRMQAKR